LKWKETHKPAMGHQAQLNFLLINQEESSSSSLRRGTESSP